MRGRLVAIALLVLVVIPLLIYSGRYQKPIRVVSPGGRAEISFRLDENGTPLYSVTYARAPIVVDAPLGLDFRQGGPLVRGLERTGFERRGADETYEIVAGKSAEARDRYDETTVSLKERERPRRRIEIVLRAYDDGVAFRYEIPRQKLFRPLEIVAERTCFRFTDNHACWAQRLGGFASALDRPYEAITLDEITPSSLVAPPITIRRQDGIVVAVAEADVSGGAGMSLAALEGSPHTLVSRLSPLPDTSGVCVRAESPYATPWRVIMLGARAGDLVESSIVTSLSREQEIDDASWIKPGKALFPWWPAFRTDLPGVPNALTLENQKYYVDFAAANGIEYLEIDPPWYGPEQEAIERPETFDITKSAPGFDVRALIDYAAEKGVGCILWAHWKSVDRQLDSVFAVYERWGVKGVKIAHMNRDDQDMEAWREKALRKAAGHRLLVCFHGAVKATGLRRTWPNLVTRGGVLGNESNKRDRAVTPEHNVTIPFTRMLAGPMDYAPGGFDNVRPEDFVPDAAAPRVMTTRCQQLAMYVVYESPLQMVCDWPGAYAGAPEFEFIRAVPTSWDETRAIDGAIGDYIVIARRRGTQWYLGAMTDGSPRRLVVPLDFLHRGMYEATIYADGPDAAVDPKRVTIRTEIFSARDSLALDLAPGGGCAIRFARKK